MPPSLRPELDILQVTKWYNGYLLSKQVYLRVCLRYCCCPCQPARRPSDIRNSIHKAQQEAVAGRLAIKMLELVALFASAWQFVWLMISRPKGSATQPLQGSHLWRQSISRSRMCCCPALAGIISHSSFEAPSKSDVLNLLQIGFGTMDVGHMIWTISVVSTLCQGLGKSNSICPDGKFLGRTAGWVEVTVLRWKSFIYLNPGNLQEYVTVCACIGLELTSFPR